MKSCRTQTGAGYDQVNPATVLKSKLKEIVKDTEELTEEFAFRSIMVCLQSHCFDDKYEPSDFTVYDYLMQKGHLIMMMGQVKDLLNFKDKMSVFWHMKMGVQVQLDRLKVPHREQYPFDTLSWKEFDAVYNKFGFAKQMASCVFCITSMSTEIQDLVALRHFDEEIQK